MIRNKYHILLSFIFLCVNIISAQNDSISFKNEIGVNIGPIAIIGLGSNQIFSQPIEINYKRNIKNRFYIKSYIQHKKQFPLSNNGDILKAIEIIDSSQFNVYYYSIDRFSRAIALGLEYRTYNDNWGMIYGVNFKYMYFKNQIINYYNVFNYNIGNIQSPYMFDKNFKESHYKEGNLLTENSFGLEPNFGFYINLNKRISLITQARVYMGYGTQTLFNHDYTTWQSSTQKFQVFRFDTDPLITEFSINYRF